ncbi:MAG TPA: hypothetical protein VFJ93_07635 [Gaiellaceae bacterium]|nr:hypothetical protein [Gaiellaceae bacterium]
MSDPLVDVQFDQKSLDRMNKTLAKFEGKPLLDRLNKGTLAALKLLVPAVQAAAPIGPTGNLRRKVKAAKSRTGQGAYLNSAAPEAHLVIRPHRIVTPGGRFTGRMTKGNPFIDNAAEPRMDQAMAEVQKALFADD